MELLVSKQGNSWWWTPAIISLWHHIKGCKLVSRLASGLKRSIVCALSRYCPPPPILLLTYLQPAIAERWEEYKQLRRHENIKDERVRRRLRTRIYAEVLVEIYQNQPATISEIAHGLGYHREWVRKVVRWLEEAKLVRSFQVSNCNDEGLRRAAQAKLERMLSKGLRGAAYNNMRNARFHGLTLRGENFLGIALRTLNLESDGHDD